LYLTRIVLVVAALVFEAMVRADVEEVTVGGRVSGGGGRVGRVEEELPVVGVLDVPPVRGMW
jgi:hypothetical protein